MADQGMQGRARSSKSDAPSSPRDTDAAHGTVGGKQSISKYANLSHDDARARYSESEHHYHGPSGPFVTQIRQKDDERDVVWEARRHRRNLRPWHRRHEGDAEAKSGSYASSDIPAKFVGGAKGPRVADAMWAISATVGPSYAIGSILFVLGGVASLWPGYVEGTWSTLKADLLVNVPYFVGAVLYWLGAYATVLEAANVDYRSDLRRWKEATTSGPAGVIGSRRLPDAEAARPKPRLHLLPVATHVKHAFLSYYGGHIQYGGAITYVVATTGQLLEAHYAFSDTLSLWLVTVPYFVGGVCFWLGGYLLAVEARHAWLYGALPPAPSRLGVMGDWVQFLNYFGSFLFFLGGVFIFAPEGASTLAFQLCNGLTFVPGSLLFLVQAALLTYESFSPQA